MLKEFLLNMEIWALDNGNFCIYFKGKCGAFNKAICVVISGEINHHLTPDSQACHVLPF